MKAHISYEETVEGMFDLVEEANEYIKIRTNQGNIITIPRRKVNRIKIKENERRY